MSGELVDHAVVQVGQKNPSRVDHQMRGDGSIIVRAIL